MDYGEFFMFKQYMKDYSVKGLCLRGNRKMALTKNNNLIILNSVSVY